MIACAPYLLIGVGLACLILGLLLIGAVRS
jgi:hypothetical protein